LRKVRNSIYKLNIHLRYIDGSFFVYLKIGSYSSEKGLAIKEKYSNEYNEKKKVSEKTYIVVSILVSI